MKLAYYPGCSLQSSSEAYDTSARAVCEALGVELYEVDDWNCCGATEARTLNAMSAHALIARNLARVDAELNQVAAPCAACYLNLNKTNRAMESNPQLAKDINSALAAGGLSYQPGRVRVRHLLDVLHGDVGEGSMRAAMKKPLSGIRIAPYYGCQIVRPRAGFDDDTEHPQKLDEMLRWLGATVVDYPMKTHCCGGHMTQISEDMALELIHRLLRNADEAGVHALACLCPMCQLNLDAYQSRVNSAYDEQFKLPVLFFTQLIGLALGMSEKDMGIGKGIVSAKGALSARTEAGKGAAEPQAQRRKPRRAESGLPMPTRKGIER